jgi:hypothetical protein
MKDNMNNMMGMQNQNMMMDQSQMQTMMKQMNKTGMMGMGPMMGRLINEFSLFSFFT